MPERLRYNGPQTRIILYGTHFASFPIALTSKIQLKPLAFKDIQDKINAITTAAPARRATMARIKFLSAESNEHPILRGLAQIARVCLSLPAGLLLVLCLPLLFTSFILCSGASGLIGFIMGESPTEISLSYGKPKSE
jgi:hypothetical protein